MAKYYAYQITFKSLFYVNLEDTCLVYLQEKYIFIRQLHFVYDTALIKIYIFDIRKRRIMFVDFFVNFTRNVSFL